MSDFDISDSILLNRLTKGDYAAFTLIYERYVAPMYTYAKKIGMDIEEIEDAIQDVFASLWIRRDKVQIFELKAWLYTSLRKQMLHRLRKKKYHTTFENYVSFFTDEHQSTNSIIGTISYKELLTE